MNEILIALASTLITSAIIPYVNSLFNRIEKIRTSYLELINRLRIHIILQKKYIAKELSEKCNPIRIICEDEELSNVILDYKKHEELLLERYRRINEYYDKFKSEKENAFEGEWNTPTNIKKHEEFIEEYYLFLTRYEVLIKALEN